MTCAPATFVEFAFTCLSKISWLSLCGLFLGFLFYFTDLMSIPLSIPHSLDNCSYKVSLEIGYTDFSYFILFLKKNSNSISFDFPCKFLNRLTYVYKNYSGISRGFVINTSINLERIDTFIMWRLPNHENISPFTKVFFDYFHQYFVILGIQICICFVKYISKYFTFFRANVLLCF